MAKTTCLCGCGKQVTHRTQLQHLSGEGTLAARVALLHNNNTQSVRNSGVQKRTRIHQPQSRHSSLPGSDEDLDRLPPAAPSPPTRSPDLSASHVPRRRIVTIEDVPELDGQDDGRSPSPIQQDDSDEEDWNGQPESNAFGFTTAPWLQGLDALDILSEQFDLERARTGFHLSDQDMQDIRAFNYIVDTNLGAGNYEKLRRSRLAPNLETLYRLQSRICFLTGVKPVDYHCCINSCICFTRHYSELDVCPFCHEPRHDAHGKPRHIFSYLPIIGRLINMFLDVDTIQKMKYRADYNTDPTSVADTFDSEHYRRLLTEFVRVGGEQLGHRFFELLTDIALALSTDGVGPFKSRKKTCWPLLVFNLNLPPEIRFHLLNIICLGVIPGPKSPVDIDSFLWPFFLELEALMRGVPAFDKELMRKFSLRAYLIYVFGDMPAVSKLMSMKGVNGYSPCRMCYIHGIADPSKPRTLYTPLARPGADSYNPTSLPLRTHSEFLEQAIQVDEASTDAEANRLSREYGINGIPLLGMLSSISIPDSFPFDFMHLIENLMPTLVAHWTGTFKEVSTGDEDYVITREDWEAIGEACKSAGDTMPSSFGSRVPNIATERYEFKAENWFSFLMFLGPAVLHKRLKSLYFKHFLDLVRLFNDCLSFELTCNDVDELDRGFVKWVQDYEQLYYRHDLSRVSACTLPIHSLLHIARNIRRTGPMWCYWNFPTERFCGVIVRSIKSRKHPYTSMSHRLRDVAQLNQLKLIYKLSEELDLSDRRAEDTAGVHFADYPTLILLPPLALNEDRDLRDKVAAYLATNFTNGLRTRDVINYVPQNLKTYKKLKYLGHGDTIHSKAAYTNPDASRRDTSFVKYILEVDRNASRPRREVDMVESAYYGQVLLYLTLDIPADFPFARVQIRHGQEQARTLILAYMEPVKRDKDNSTRTPCFHKFAPREIIDVGSILGLVGRVWDVKKRKWLLVGRPETMSLVDGATYGA